MWSYVSVAGFLLYSQVGTRNQRILSALLTLVTCGFITIRYNHSVVYLLAMAALFIGALFAAGAIQHFQSTPKVKKDNAVTR